MRRYLRWTFCEENLVVPDVTAASPRRAKAINFMAPRAVQHGKGHHLWLRRASRDIRIMYLNEDTAARCVGIAA